jgi:serine/threonine protein kinase
MEALLGGKVDSLHAFTTAVVAFDSQISLVQRLNSAKSVWACFSGTEGVGVLKYFQTDLHSQSHFFAEKEFLISNTGNDLLPQLLGFSDSDSWLALEFLKNDSAGRQGLCDLLAYLERSFKTLTLERIVHSGPPGVLSWWRQSQFESGAQEILMNLAKSTDWFTSFCERSEEQWVPEVLVHGDIKLQNLILESNAVKVIDWENASFGPKNWDRANLVGSVIAETLVDSDWKLWSIDNLGHVVSLLEQEDTNFRLTVAVRLVQSSLESSAKTNQVSLGSANLMQAADLIAKSDFSFLRDLERNEL